MSTPWRKLLYKELEKITLSGQVIDLGGSRKSNYHQLFKGQFAFEVSNIDEEYGYDIKLNLEEKFQISDAKYDAVLAINVLEHIYNYDNFLSESYRILKNGGKMVVGVPFFIQIHPCPQDYWRYSGETLTKIMTKVGFKNVEVITVGRGPFTVIAQILYGILIFDFLRFVVSWVAWFLDFLIFLIKPKFAQEMFPLGYVVIAKK